ncbi:unnamed protein product, partial [Ixodes hexagonus]
VALCWLATLTLGQPSQNAPLYQQPQRERPRAAAHQSPYFYPPAPVHYVNIGEKLDGDYKFGYDTGSGPAGQSYREEFRLPDGSVKGSYGYIDSRGHMRKVHYTAGKSGFIILKDERIVDKKSSTSAPKVPPVEYHVTTPPRPEYTTQEPEPVVQQTAAPVQQESRQVERQFVAAPVVFQKTAQELQAEYNRNILAASSTVPRQQYAAPEGAAEQVEPLEQSPKPAPRPRHQRRRKRPKTVTSTTEAPPRDIEVQRPPQVQRELQQQFRNFGTSLGQLQPVVVSQPQYRNPGTSSVQPQSGVSVQPQYTTFGAQGAQRPSTVSAQPNFGSLGNVQQSYDPYQQFNGGFQLPNTLFSPVQQNSQQLDNPYQFSDANPFQAQFGGPYQPQYSNLQSFPQYQTTGGRGLGSFQDSTVQSYRATNAPVIDRTLLSYDIGVPVRSRS